MIRLAVDNTKPQPMLAANDDEPVDYAGIGHAISRALNRLCWLAFWIALGIAAGLAI